jgi:hypothetical protein
VGFVEAALVRADGVVVQVLDFDLGDGCEFLDEARRLGPQRPVFVADALRGRVEPLIAALAVVGDTG